MRQTDRSTQALLFAIALGLWLHLITAWLRPVPVHAGAQGIPDVWSTLQNVESAIGNVESAVRDVEIDTVAIKSDLQKIAKGTCLNGKIC